MIKKISLILLCMSIILHLGGYKLNASQDNVNVQLKVLSESMKNKLDVVVDNFFTRLDLKYQAHDSKIMEALEESSGKLMEYSKDHIEYKNIIEYVLSKIHKKNAEIENQDITISIIKDLQYNQTCSKCTLDIYYKSDTIQDKKVIFFVHGGAWKLGDKGLHNIKGEFFAEQNYIFVSVNYSLFPNVEYKKQVGEVGRAFKYVYSNIEKFGGNKTDITMMGHSAGGHLISLLSTNEDYLTEEGLGLSNINGTILLDSAGLDIVGIKKNAPLTFKIAYKDVFGGIEKELVDASPISYINKGKAIPDFLIFYSGERKSLQNIPKSFHEKLRLNNINSTIYPISKSHEEINEHIGREGDIITQKILEFLK